MAAPMPFTATVRVNVGAAEAVLTAEPETIPMIAHVTVAVSTARSAVRRWCMVPPQGIAKMCAHGPTLPSWAVRHGPGYSIHAKTVRTADFAHHFLTVP